MRAIPAEVQAEVEALRRDGWAPIGEAVEATGRSYAEMTMLWESGEVEFRDAGRWWDDGVPCVERVVHLADLRTAPRRTPLHLVT